MQGKYGHSLTTAKHIQKHADLSYVAEYARGAFSIMKGIVNFFTNKAPNVSNPKALKITEVIFLTC